MGNARLAGFVSYAHDDAAIVDPFLELMKPRCGALRDVELVGWWDRAILCGDRWRQEIDAALERCDFGLVLVTPSFLASRFIGTVELPALLASGRAVFPVGIERVDFARADLKRLEDRQIFGLRAARARQARWFSECAGVNRARFCDRLVGEMVDRLLHETGVRWPSV